MAIIKALIAGFGGSLTSLGDNQGTTFIFKLLEMFYNSFDSLNT